MKRTTNLSSNHTGAVGGWPQLSITLDSTAGTANVRLVGFLGHTLAEDWYRPRDRGSIKASARWLGISPTRLYDETLHALIDSSFE